MFQHLIQIKNLIKTRPGEPAYKLHIPCLNLNEGECLAILGSSGSGKSTILDILSLILQPDSAQEFQ